ncbi:MAG: cation:proton antiporter [Pseudomonadota bacterium]
MFIAATIAILISMILALVRAIAGPTLYDRILAGNSFGTKTVLLLGVMGFLTGRPDFLDIALVYALINFAGTIAILKFFRYRTLSAPMDGKLIDRPQFGVNKEGGIIVPDRGGIDMATAVNQDGEGP